MIPIPPEFHVLPLQTIEAIERNADSDDLRDVSVEYVIGYICTHLHVLSIKQLKSVYSMVRSSEGTLLSSLLDPLL